MLFSILFIEVLAETILNFNFFKDVSEDYIIGGVYNAFLLSLINVGILGWLFGKNCFWFKNHINKTKATLGWASLGLFLFLSLLLNYFVGVFFLNINFTLYFSSSACYKVYTCFMRSYFSISRSSMSINL